MPIPGDFEYRNVEAEETLNDIGQMLRSACPQGMGLFF
jgi:hypothetical protein